MSNAAANERIVAGFGHVPPLSYRGAAGQPAGFAIEVMQEAARRENIDLRWQATGDSRQIDQDLKSGVLDVFPAGMVTPERRAAFYVSEPWWRIEMSVLARRDRIRSTTDLKGKRLALAAPVYAFLAQEHFPDTAAWAPSTVQAGARVAADAVCSGGADAALMTHMDVHQILLDRPPACRDVQLQTLETAAVLHIAVLSTRSGQHTAKRLRQRVDQLVEDGVLASIAARHAPVSAINAEQMGRALRYRYERRLLIVWSGASLFLLALAGWFLTTQRRTRDALRRGRDERQLLLDTLPVGIWFTDRSGRVVGWNPRALEIWGAQQQGLAALEFVGWNPATGEPLKPHEWGSARAARAGEKVHNELIRIQPFDGSAPKYILNSAAPLRDRRGVIRGAIVTNQEVTDRVLAEDALRESEQRYRAFFERAVVGTVKVDPVSRRFLEVNQKLCELTGYTREELLTMEFSDLTHPDDRAGELEAFGRFVRGETPAHSIEKRYVRKDGEVRWVNVETGGVRNASGALLYTVGVVLDITERVRGEEALRRSEERYRFLVEANPVGFVHAAIDGPEKGRFYHVNDAFLRIVGYSREEVERGDVDWVTLTPPEWLPEDEKATQRARETGRSGLYEKEYVRKDGSRVPLLVECAAVGAHDAVAFAIDISERRRLEKQVTWMSGLLPICAGCKQIKDNESGRWQSVESYMQGRISADFSHSLCPGCIQTLYPEFADDISRQRII